MLSKTNLLAQCEQLDEYWSPRIVGEVNDQYVKVAKLLGSFVWHKHDNEDELFYILQGALVEKKSTQHTGDIVTAKTRSVDDQLGLNRQ